MPQQADIVTPAEVERWWSDLTQADQRGQCFAALTAFIMASTKL